jgi:CheY-specific phosphatase CheX
MNVQEQDIREITGAVWTSVLQTNAEWRPEAQAPQLSGTIMTGCVQISGAWEGAVMIQVPVGVARAAAAAMFESSLAETSSEEVRDALGELANMVGGNIKALLPGPTQLSLPLVVEGGKSALSICDAVAVRTVWFAAYGEEFLVTLLSRSDRHESAHSSQKQPTGGLAP